MYIGIILQVFSCIGNTSTINQFQKEIDTWSKTFSELLYHIKTRHYIDIQAEDAFMKAMDAMLQSDPHSKLLNRKQMDDLHQQTQGAFAGIGVSLLPKQQQESTMTIIDIVDDSPAQEAGLQPYDQIITIDRKSIQQQTTETAMNLLRGAPQTSVELLFIRNGVPETKTITRQELNERFTQAYKLDHQNLYYAAILFFSRDVPAFMDRLLKRALQEQARGIIIDLRDNQGGLLTSAIDTASLFVPYKSPIVTTKDRHNKTRKTFTTERRPHNLKETPICILTNQRTASAAEILASSLKAFAEKTSAINPHIFVIGTQTFGKGSVQEVIPLSNQCAAKMTTALYYVDDVPLQCYGVTPDFTIHPKARKRKEEELINSLHGHEATLHNAITSSTQTTTQETQSTPRHKTMISEDATIQYATHLIGHVRSRPKNLQKRSDVLTYLKQLSLTDEDDGISAIDI
jgi:carboxyl-terminal processing protease